MLAVIVANVVLMAIVFSGIIALLSWGIRSDRVAATTLERRRRVARDARDARDRHRAAAPRFSPAYTRGS